MESFARIGMGGMLIVGVVVGVRLLLLARRTRLLPELVMGVSSVGIGAGAALIVQGSALLESGAPMARTVFIAGLVGTSLGAFFLGLGLWKIFRPDVRWPALLMLVSGLVLAGSFASLVLADESTASPAEHPAYFVGFAVRLFMYGWLAIESISYGTALRRRVQLGLAAPAMVSRFYCWGASGSTAFAGYLVYFACAWQGIAPPPPVSLGLGLIGFVTAASMWFAFFPPSAWDRWVERRLATQGA